MFIKSEKSRKTSQSTINPTKKLFFVQDAILNVIQKRNKGTLTLVFGSVVIYVSWYECHDDDDDMVVIVLQSPK